MGRSPCCAKEGLNRGAWTAIEDRILTDYINTHGEGDWRYLPKHAGLKRCGKSCRLRWLNYLRPDIRRGNITQDEEDLIIRLHKLLGNRWSLIAGRLPGRTDNEIKNYWNTNLSKRLEQLHHCYRRKVRSKNQQLLETPAKDGDPEPVPADNIRAIRTKAVRCTRPVFLYPGSHQHNYQLPKPPDHHTSTAADVGGAGMIIPPHPPVECNYDDIHAVVDFGGFDECLRYLPDMNRTGLDEFSDIDNVEFGNYVETMISNSVSASPEQGARQEQQPEMLFSDIEMINHQDDYWNWITTKSWKSSISDDIY